MRHLAAAVTAAAVITAPQSATASDRDFVIQAVPTGYVTASFTHGVVSAELVQRAGAIQVTPVQLDHGNVGFDIVVMNGGTTSADIGPENLTIATNSGVLRALTPDQLESKARSRAIWRQVAVAALSGVAAGISASQRNYYHGSTTISGPYGTSVIHSSFSAPSIAGQIQAAQFQTMGLIGSLAISDQLERTRTEIRDRALLRDTVMPGESYGGRIVLARFKPTAYPQRIDLAVAWNGETYRFAFQLARRGTPQPVFATVAAPLRRPAIQPAAMPATQPSSTVTMAAVSGATTLAVAQRTVAYPATTPVVLAAVALVPVMLTPAPALTSYERQLVAQRGVHGREPRQGWSISE